MQETIILGIDPGTTIMGFGIIKTNGKSQVEMLEMGALHLSKYKDHALKLKKIFDKCSQLIETYSPDVMAVEAPFFGKNVQSMLKLGRAQGVAFSAALVKIDTVPPTDGTANEVAPSPRWIWIPEVTSVNPCQLLQ